MARPRRYNVDYFPHDCVHPGKTINLLQKKYGVHGYAFWWKLLEKLGHSDGLWFEFTDSEIEFFGIETWVSGVKNGVSGEEMVLEIMSLLVRLDAIDKNLWENHRVVWCQKFADRVKDAFKKRTDFSPEKPVFGEETQVSGEETTNESSFLPENAAKGKGNKINKRKKTNGYSEDFESFWKLIIHRPDDRKADAWNHWKKQSKFLPAINELLNKVSEYNKSCINKDPIHIMATYNWLKNQMWNTTNANNLSPKNQISPDIEVIEWTKDGRPKITKPKDDGIYSCK